LEGRLVPYWRLRIGGTRIIYQVKVEKGERRIYCFFADYRATVYRVVEQLLASDLMREIGEL
jgi:mRNA-degrading endonuclease RelE of RelBE toxin-antitoxin system